MTQQDWNEATEAIDAALTRLESQTGKPPPLFVAVDRVIMLGRYCVGRMKSKNFAIRTANALNSYKPNERGV